MIRLMRSKIVLALSLMVVVLLFGVVGYKMLSDFTWIEAIYMTIITVTTVGFSEVRPLDANAKIFTVFLIVTSVFIFGFAISVVSEYILGRNSLEVLKKKKVKKQIDSLSNHVVVCGFGRNGMQAAEKLIAYESCAFTAKLHANNHNHIILSMRERAELTKQNAINQAKKQLQNGQMPEQVIENFAYTLTNQLLHEPTVKMKKALMTQDEAMIETFKQIFGVK